VLLESGANALAAGFTLEAAASFSSALERFYEFCIKVILTHQNMSQEVYEQMFKGMANQSERQLGAFLALHAVLFGAAYVPNMKIVEFRNSVVHKGRIPNVDETKTFCEKVYGEILKLSESLKQVCSTAINEVVIQDLKKRSDLVPKGTPIATTTGTIFFNLANSDKKPTFTEAFDAYIKGRNVMTSAVPMLKFFAPLLQCVAKPKE
jgi:hypothetical protein